MTNIMWTAIIRYEINDVTGGISTIFTQLEAEIITTF